MTSIVFTGRVLRTWLWRGLLIALVAAGSLWAGLPSPIAWAATITVNTTTDEYNGDGDCSLREAIIAANTDTAVDACAAGSGVDTIQLPSGIYSFAPALSGSDDDAAKGDLDINDSLNLTGVGATAPVIDASLIDRVFHVGAQPGSPTLTLTRLVLRRGNPGSAAGSAISVYRGSLTLVNVRVVQSTGTYAGGSYAIYATSLADDLEIVDSQIDDNLGGLYIASTVNALIARSTISGNSVTGAAVGGGLYNAGTVKIVNTTISGNLSETDGGGLYNAGTASLFNVTLANNMADSDANATGSGGGLRQAGTLTLRNTLIADNSLGASPSGADCSGTLTTAGHNLIEAVTGCSLSGSAAGDQLGVSAALDALDSYGGLTATHRLQSGSLATDAGDPGGCIDELGATLTTDQRGFARDALCDIGAYEAGSAGTPTPTPSLTPTAPPSATATPTGAPTATSSQYLYLTSLQR